MAEISIGRTYIRVHDGITDHPKVAPLGNAAFRLLIDAWCWCSRYLTDGRIPIGVWRRKGTKKAREELLAAGLAEFDEHGDVAMHDYLEHQRSREEAGRARAERSEDGALGAHKRWHVRRGRIDPDCVHCAQAQPEPKAPPMAPPIAPPIGGPSGSHSPAIAETETETETDKVVGHRDHLQVVDAPTRHDDDRLRAIDSEIRAVLGAATRVTVSPEHAARIRTLILAGRTVADPMAYAVKAVKADPVSWLPGAGRWARPDEPLAGPSDASLPSAYSTSVAEAIARARPDHRPNRPSAAQGA